MSQIYHLGPYPYFQAPLIISGASEVNCLPRQGDFPLLTIRQGNAVELGGMTSPDDLQDGDAVSARLNVVIRGASHLVDSIGSAVTRHNALSLEISGDREVRISRTHRVLTPEEEQQALDANDRSARAIVEQAETVDNLEQLFQEQLGRYLEANDMRRKDEKLALPKFGPIRITDKLAVSVRSTGGVLGGPHIMIFGAWKALAAYHNKGLDPKIAPTDMEVLHRQAALGQLCRLGDFAFHLDREIFKARALKARKPLLKIKNQDGYSSLVARLQEEWGLSPFTADFFLRRMAYLPIDPDSHEDIEFLASLSHERGAALMAAYKTRHQMAPSVFRYAQPDGRVADHSNFGLRLDPFIMQGAIKAFFKPPHTLFHDDASRHTGPAFPEQVSYWGIMQRDFFTPGDAASIQETWLSPSTSLKYFLKYIKDLRSEGVVNPHSIGSDIQVAQPGQKIERMSDSGKINVEFEVEPFSGGDRSRFVAQVAITQEISRRMVRKYSIGELDFDYLGVPKATFVLDGQSVDNTEIELLDTGDATDPGFLKMYFEIEMLAGHTHNLVIEGPDIRGKKRERIEIQIKAPPANEP